MTFNSKTWSTPGEQNIK